MKLPKIVLIALLISVYLLLTDCRQSQQATHQPAPSNSSTQSTAAVIDSNHQATPLPIQLELLSDAERQVITDLNNKDTSSYLIATRPIVFQIQGITNNQDQSRSTRSIYKETAVMIYSLGEMQDSLLLDYGWIEDAYTNKVVWQMTPEKSQYAGGSPQNIKIVDHITLPAGTYRLRYKSNPRHAVGDWQGTPPENPFYYGITVFNLAAIELINAEFDKNTD